MKKSAVTTLFLAVSCLSFLASAAYALNASEAINSDVPAANTTSRNTGLKRLLSSETSESFIAGLRLDSSSRTVCAGALIAPKYVLTTHCYSAYKYRFGAWTIEGLQIAVGASTISGAGDHGEIIKASKLYAHPDYNMQTRENEFFIVKLSSASKLTPVTLADADGSGIIYGSSSGAMMFWADHSYLQTTVMSFTNPTVCAKKQSITDTHLCASAVVKSDACSLEPGDLLLQSKSSGNVLVGLMSINNACDSATPVVFSKVSTARAWIKSVAGVGIPRLPGQEGRQLLPSNDPDVISMRSGAIPERVRGLLATKIVPAEEIAVLFANAPRSKTIHVLVVAPKQERQSGVQDGVLQHKRIQFDEWYLKEELSPAPKRIKLGDDEAEDDQVSIAGEFDFETKEGGKATLPAPNETQFFDMVDFPPLIHRAADYKRVFVRNAYTVIFDGMMKDVKDCFEHKAKGHVIVTGNPGIGKSRFLLYCALQLATQQLDVVKSLPPFVLVLNCLDVYNAYEANRKEFRLLTLDEAFDLSLQQNVLRLIDGTPVAWSCGVGYQ